MRIIRSFMQTAIKARYFSSSCAKYQKALPENNNTNEEYFPIYKFSYIRGVALVNRLKFFHTVGCAAIIPSTIAGYALDLTDLQGLQLICSLGLSGCLSLYGVGYICTKFVGFVYTNKNCDKVKIAYVDFWGKRQELELPQSDIVPFIDIPPSLTDKLYLKLKTHSSKDLYKINRTSCEMFDPDRFNKVFSSEYLM